MTTNTSFLAGLAADPSVRKVAGLVNTLRRQLSRQILLVDFSDGCAVVAQCRLRGKGCVDLRPINITELPPEAVEKGAPSEPEEMAALLLSVMDESGMMAQRAGTILPDAAFTTMLLRIAPELSRSEIMAQLGESGSAVQLPFPRQQADLALVDVSQPDAPSTQQRAMLLMAVQRSNTDRLVHTFRQADLELQFIDSGVLAPLRLIAAEIEALGLDEQLLHLSLSPGVTTCTVVQRGGPQAIERLAPVRPCPLKRCSGHESDDYFPLTPEDLLSLQRDLRKLIQSSAPSTVPIMLAGTGSGHPGIEELLEEELELPIQVVRPLQHPQIGSSELPEGFNPQALGRIVGMALRCLEAGKIPMPERRRGDRRSFSS